MPKPFLLPPNTLDPELEHKLEPLCIDLPPERIAELHQQIAAHVPLVLQVTQYNECLDLSAARQIAQILTSLLQEHASYPPVSQLQPGCLSGVYAPCSPGRWGQTWLSTSLRSIFQSWAR